MNDLSATDRCVKCGLCLPHCPTFALTGNEADSPRGRISLMQALGEQEVLWSDGLFRHLDQCLHCGACEAMCPSGVPFGRLMDEARVVIEPRRQRSLLQRLLRRTGLGIVASPAGLGITGAVLGFYRKSGLHALTNRLPGLPATVRRLNRLLPASHATGHSAHANTPAPEEKRGSVNLFRGCAGSVLDQQTLQATTRLLQKLGYRVNVPAAHPCCGALHRHNAAPDTAQRLAQTNLEHFSGNDDPVLVTASACTAQLQAYANLYAGKAATAFAARVSDIMHFLATAGLADLHFMAPQQKVAVYLPCTHRNVLGQQQDVMQVLQCLPGTAPRLINPDGGCCGAAGAYLLSQPELSDRLARRVAARILESGAEIILTTNIGCAIQLQAALQAHSATIEVLHPVVLLERLLPAPHSPSTKGT
ncbi:MAG TPA: (Fe-S)-binding protein [Gammaproteobacteria bacterium]|nr:(Fe-S)-binding protein [Gammaproteobacteria bacterium]